MAANECIPTRTGGPITAKCGAAVTGKRFVKITAARTGGGLNAIGTDLVNVYVVTNCTVSGEVAVGVAQNDQAINQLVGVFKRHDGWVLPVTAGADITAGQEVQTDATGKAIPLASGKALGQALDSATSGNDVEISIY